MSSPHDPKSVEGALKGIENDPRFRIQLTRENHMWFFMTYLTHHMSLPFAPFHREIFRLTQDCDDPLRIVVAFRDSGKSTIVSLSYPIWAAVTGRKKFILIISKTETQAKQILYNIKSELESNPCLEADYGPFNVGDVWNESSLVLPRLNTRIVALSSDSSLRGLKNLANRPDLIIIDDVEDLDSVRTSEIREKRYRWLKSEVIPAGSMDCTVFIVGNLLHEDSLIARLEEEIDKKELSGVYRRFPIVIGGRPAWPAKFPTMESIEELKHKIGDQRAFRREFMQEVVAERDQVVLLEWIKYYVTLPDSEQNGLGWYFSVAGTGVDLAISQRESADYTAMVSGYVYHRKIDLKHSEAAIYILPNVVNRHLTFEGIVQAAKVTKHSVNRSPHNFYVEDVAFQRAAVEEFRTAGLTTFGVSPDGMDKRSRLMLAARQMELGKVYFPKIGCEDVIRQILGFGSERHDDLADACAMLINQLSKHLYVSNFSPILGGTKRPKWMIPDLRDIWDCKF